jgi:hypothetical protein
MAAWISEARAAWLRVGPLVLTAAPVVIAAFLLQALGPLKGPLTTNEAAVLQRAISKHEFLPGALSLIAVLVVHVSVCLCGITIAWRMIKARDPSLVMAIVGLVLGLGTIMLIPIFARPDVSIYQLSYFLFKDLYLGTGARDSFLYPRLFGLTPLALAVLIPVALGIIGVALMAAASNEELVRLPGPPVPPLNRRYEVKLQVAQGRLRRALYLLSIGLVTSTVAASLFFHLPAKLVRAETVGQPAALNLSYQQLAQERQAARLAAAPGNALAHSELLARVELARTLREKQDAEIAELKRKFEEFAAELSIFWGAVFTLIMLAAAGLPMLRLQQRVRAYSETISDPRVAAAAGKRLAEAGLLSQGVDQFKFLFAVIAPLASAPVANFAQTVAGAA